MRCSIKYIKYPCVLNKSITSVAHRGQRQYLPLLMACSVLALRHFNKASLCFYNFFNRFFIIVIFSSCTKWSGAKVFHRMSNSSTIMVRKEDEVMVISANDAAADVKQRARTTNFLFEFLAKRSPKR